MWFILCLMNSNWSVIRRLTCLVFSLLEIVWHYFARRHIFTGKAEVNDFMVLVFTENAQFRWIWFYNFLLHDIALAMSIGVKICCIINCLTHCSFTSYHMLLNLFSKVTIHRVRKIYSLFVNRWSSFVLKWDSLTKSSRVLWILVHVLFLVHLDFIVLVNMSLFVSLWYTCKSEI